MSNFRADLHTHSTCSDGVLTPRQLIEKAKDFKLQGLSITDHDTINAYQEAVPLAKLEDIELLSGVEFSASHQGKSVHVLGYAFPYDSAVIHAFAARHLERRHFRNKGILDRLKELNMPLEEADFPEGTFSTGHPVGRPHIAQAMIKRGYITSIQQAFHLFLGEGKPCFIPGVAFSVEETIAIIHEAKGLAVIAHPHLIKNARLTRDLLAMPFDGLEGYYAHFALKEQQRWIKIGEEKKWLITGGSDFHGDIKPSNPLGSSWVQKETFDLLMNHLKNNL